MIYYISGGARSGKSRYAMRLAKSLSENPIYLATARLWDADFKQRINRHKTDRDDSWEVIEKEKNLFEIDFTLRVVVVDCITLWLTNYWMDLHQNMNTALSEFKNETDKLVLQDATFIFISNEIGMGLHPHEEKSRKFVDLQGWANQYVADKADKAIFMVSGLPIEVK